MDQNLSGNGGQIHEDKWKLALDAAGDGMWDLNVITGEINFSEKWHDIFGYDQTEIATLEQWLAKIHPEDHVRYRQRSEAYISGDLPSYSIEQRFLCKDGT